MNDPMSEAFTSVLIASSVIFFITIGSVIITSKECSKPTMVFAIVISIILWVLFATISGEYIHYIAGM